MKVPKTAENRTSEIEVYKNFMRLDSARRRRVAVRILRNQKMLADLYDHMLIQRSLDERGENLTWESYKRANGSKP
jgi:16S rRNA A1518/A1519 N6-dimethyltransferase RsmA/KsgA/DIM1 with predicted DNA glycosylase/AP lyase activity